MERTSVLQPEHVPWNIPKDYEGITSYNPRHNIQDYLDLLASEETLPKEEFARRLLQLNTRVERQLITRLGERYSVAESTVYFTLEKGIFKNQDYDEPVIQRYKKGQKFLARNGSTETEREAADVVGIEKVQELLQDLEARETIVVISPRGPQGSLYEENFFDTWQKSPNGAIVFTRYHSSLSYQQLQNAATRLDPTFKEIPEENLTAAHFLAQPAKIRKTKEEILELLATTADTMPQEDFERHIVPPVRPYIRHYIGILVKSPLAIDEVNKSFNTIMNMSQENYDLYQKRQKLRQFQPQKLDIPPAIIAANVNHYGIQPVKPDNKGCPGGSRTFKVNQVASLKNLAVSIGARSVLDFSPFADDEDEDVTDFQCPGYRENGTKCTYIVRAYSGIKKCPECGLEGTCGN